MAWRELALLWAARECGALEALATRAGTPEAVAEAADIDPAGAEALVGRSTPGASWPASTASTNRPTGCWAS